MQPGHQGQLRQSGNNDRSSTMRGPPHLMDGTITSQLESNLSRTLSVMQSFMIKKGIIDASMTEDEIQLFLQEEEGKLDVEIPQRATVPITEKQKQGKTGKGNNEMTNLASMSDVTIYKRAVQQLVPGLEQQIYKYVQNVHKSAEVEDQLNNLDNQPRKISSSSDELNSSDESTLANMRVFAGVAVSPKKGNDKVADVSPEEHADQLLLDAEQSKARMLEIEGKDLQVLPNIQNIALMDNNYQIIDAHVEEGLKRKILNFEYVYFSHLLPKNKAREDEGRLEFVTKKGLLS